MNRMDLTPELIDRILHHCARRMDAPLATFVPASGRVLIMHDYARPGTLVFRIIGLEQPTCIVWEDNPPRVAWVREANLTAIATVA